jgi:hypothetical protein
MSNNTQRKLYEVDREKRTARCRTPHAIKQTCVLIYDDTGERAEQVREFNLTQEQAEGRQIVAQAAQSFINTVEFYKAEEGGSKPHSEAVKDALKISEKRREWVEGLQPEKISFGHLAAIAEISMEDALKLWARVREAATDELESGRRGATVTGADCDPYAQAQYLSIRDAFADQWQPRGGIESAMIDMLAVSFSLQMYWATVAHQRAIHTHDEQRKSLSRFEDAGWKSPYQSTADAIEQAHRLADGYNRQFLRVLRQLRDLRRYAPPVIVNNGGQVNVAGQQLNVSQSPA